MAEDENTQHYLNLEDVKVTASSPHDQRELILESMSGGLDDYRNFIERTKTVGLCLHELDREETLSLQKMLESPRQKRLFKKVKKYFEENKSDNLHDIAIPTHGDELHAREGARMCKPFLKNCGYSRKEIEKISETISMHSTDDPKPPETKESQVLFDADKLDATGPVALYRWFFEYSKRGYFHHDVLKKVLARNCSEFRQKNVILNSFQNLKFF